MPEAVLPPPTRAPLPQRYETARSTLWWDRFMNRFITVGGVAIITVVLGIFVFILWQVLPLFRGATVQTLQVVPASDTAEYLALGLDEYGEMPFLLDRRGRLHFVELNRPGQHRVHPLFPEDNVEVTAWRYHPGRQELLCGTRDGRLERIEIRYRTVHGGGERRLDPDVQVQLLPALARPGHPVRAVDYGDSGTDKLVALAQEVEGRFEVRAALLTQTRGLLGAGQVRVEATFDLTDQVPGRLTHLLVNRMADAILMATAEGEILYFHREGRALRLRQRFRPFKDCLRTEIVLMDFLLGDVTLVLGNAEGRVRLYSLFRPGAEGDRVFGRTKQFPDLAGPPAFYCASQRNKAFVIGQGAEVRLCYATTEKVRWHTDLEVPVQLAALNSKYDRLVLLDAQQNLRVYRLEDPHPEASWRAFFGRVWYEGADRPRFEWQSTGGSDAFEPKLSMVPLMVGTLKGTFYAMLFAVPVALLAALYVSQFAPPEFRGVVKPTMEVMASLPSVVLGFLGALWLAPRLETRVPSVLLILVLVPLAALAMGALWSRLPVVWRARVRPGYEFLALVPVLGLVGLAGWMWGPVLERWLFVVTDPATGERVADFRLWWPAFTGADFQQRNSVVVGFVMGFAVIPIIFTLAEDALSNVPATLRSGSLALGASRWQTALYIVLPTASAGIFSALMVGLGRAVGETMIVVMATGNTPILSFNPFSGMRTLSANLAVELPEAPHHSTLYRTLFLGALLLFVFTFVINTVAEILRQRLRDRFKTL
ncbi:MAG: ABC transporter permease subunit [Limisphaera sp.]|nr:ABC transporter permease subunit [Limisphaera sp.]